MGLNSEAILTEIWLDFFSTIIYCSRIIMYLKMTTIDSLIKDDDVDDGKMKKWRRSLTRSSILGLLYASANLVSLSRLLSNTESPRFVLFKVITKFSNGDNVVMSVICYANSAGEEVNKLVSMWNLDSFHFLNWRAVCKPIDHQIKFGMDKRIMTRKRSINWEVASVEVI